MGLFTMKRYHSPTMVGPSPNPTWTERTGTDEHEGPFNALTTPDASNESRLRQSLPPIEYTTLFRPKVARNQATLPRLSITFVLNQMPAPGENNIAPLIQQAVLGIDLTTAPSESLLASLNDNNTEFRPLFPQELTVKLVNYQSLGPNIAEVTAQGGIATVSLNATLNRDEALALLAALNEQDSPLGLVVAQSYRVAAGNQPSQFSTDLNEVQIFLAQVAGPDRVFSNVDLQNYLALMIQQGIVKLSNSEPLDALAAAEKARTALPAFLRAATIILEPVATTPAYGELSPEYKLTQTRLGSMIVRFETDQLGNQTVDYLELHSRLQPVLAGALSGQNLDPYVHLVLVDTNGRGTHELPRRVRHKQARSRPGPRQVALAAIETAAVPLTYAVRPDSLSSADLSSVLALPPETFQIVLPDHEYTQIDLVVEKPRRLPIVTDKPHGPWQDRVAGTDHFWYAPQFTLLTPAPTTPPDQSPFHFTYRTAGHDLQGRPGLEGTIKLTLRREMPAEVRSQLNALRPAQLSSVPMNNISIGLEIPFRDQFGNTKRHQITASSIEDNGQTLVATIRLLDDWVRMSYGALAYAGFQPGEPATVVVSYTFEAYKEIFEGFPDLTFPVYYGGKSVAVPITQGEREFDPAAGLLQVDARKGTLRYGLNEFRSLTRSAANKAKAWGESPHTAITLLPSSDFPMLTAIPIIRPQVHPAPWLTEAIRKKTYALGHHIRTANLTALFPCEQLGMMYAEEVAGGLSPIGCQDTLRLGQTSYQLLAELPLNKPNFRVYRSLQVPGRFVVVPKFYAIGRYEPTEANKAYRPLILLYTTIDVDNLTNSRCVILSTLQPALPRYERAQLLAELRRNHHPNPSILYFTELDGEVTYEWALPTSGSSGLLKLEAETNRLWDSFQVSFATDVIGVPQLQAILAAGGISGTATIHLPDGTKLWTTLQLKLSNIVGPWEAGPVEVTAAAGSVRLKNHIQPVVNVSKLLLIDADEITAELVVDTRLETDAESSLALPTTPQAITPVYTAEATAADLTEIRSFIEDIEANLVLLNRLDLAAKELARLTIVAHIQGLPDEHKVEFTPASPVVQELRFLLPLTIYIGNPVVQLRLLGTDPNGQVRELATQNWQLARHGAVIELTNQFVGL